MSVLKRGVHYCPKLHHVFGAAIGLCLGFVFSSANASADFQQTIWATTNHNVHGINADSGAVMAEANRGIQSRSIEVDLVRGVVWVYGHGRLTRYGFDGAEQLDIDVPGASPDSKSGNGNGGEQQQDMEINTTNGEVWLGVKDKLYRFSAGGDLLFDWNLDGDTRALAIQNDPFSLWLLTNNAVYHINSPANILEQIEIPTTNSLTELTYTDGALWLAADKLYKLGLDGSVLLELPFNQIRQVAGSGDGSIWVADNIDLIHIDAAGNELISFRHSGRGRTVDIEVDPRGTGVWIATQQDIIQYSHDGEEGISVSRQDISGNGRFWDIAPGIDGTAPSLFFTAPAAGACVGTATPLIELAFSDTESGVNPDTLALFHAGTALPAQCDFDEEGAACTPSESLPEGDQTILASVADFAGNVSNQAALTFHVDTVAPAITITSPADGNETFDDQILITGQLSEPAQLTVNGNTIALEGDLSFNFTSVLEFGENTFIFEAGDCTGNESSVILHVTRNRSPPEFISTPVTEVKSGQTYQYDAEATDPDPDDVLEYSVFDGPNGLTIDDETGLVEWPTTENDVGNHPVTLKVTDLNGDSDEQSFTINVTPNNLPPEIVSDAVLSVDENALYQYDLDATDPNIGDLLRYELDRDSSADLETDIESGLTKGIINSPAASIRQQNTLCRSPAEVGVIDPVIQWSWTGSNALPEYNQVMSVPLVAQLTDDNGDSVVSSLDIPDIIALTYHEDSGGSSAWSVLRAFSGDDGSELFVTDAAYLLDGRGAPAVGDLEGDGALEIVAPNYGDGVSVFDRHGTLLWRNDNSVDYENARQTITLADIDADGDAEIISGAHVLNYEGNLLWIMSGDRGSNGPHGEGLVTVADIDADGFQEIIAGPTVYEHDGSIKWRANSLPDGFTALADFDLDGSPEIVLVASANVYLLNKHGDLLWSLTAFPNGAEGGPPTIGNFDHDPEPEIGVAGGDRYVAIDTDGHVLWSSPTQDQSSRTTSSTVFDFNGDGLVEVLYADEKAFRIYNGTDGEVLYELELSSGTAYEYPVVADVDNDDQAEIIVSTDQLLVFLGREPAPGTRGLRVLESASGSWISTRSIWNQHAYSINNINDDGSIPVNPEPSWLTHNTYRLNTFPDRHALGLPELAVFDLVLDEEAQAITLVVENRGLAPATDGFQVQLFDGDPAAGGVPLGEASIESMAAGDDEIVTIGGINPFALAGPIYAVIDAGGQVAECLEDNNAVAAELIRARATDPGGLFDRQTWLVNIVNANETPTILTEQLPAANAGVDFHARIEAVDPDLGDALRYELLAGPAGLSINEISGEITWLAQAITPGSHEVTVKVTDLGGLTDQVQYNLTVADEINEPPIAHDLSLTTDEGIAIDITLTGSDPDGDALGYEITTLPEHGRVVGVPPHITYVPDAYYDGPDSFLFIVNDGALDSEPAAVEVTIAGENNPPRIISEPVTPHVLASNLSEPEPQVMSNWDLVLYPEFQPSSPNWSFTDEGLTALQTGNSDPSLLLGNFNSENKHIVGTWRVSGGDDDYVGFVVGYQNRYQTYFFDWKKNAQGTAARGYELEKYDLAPDGSEGEPYLSMNDSGANSTQLYYNDIGWIRGELYRYTVDFTPGSIRVSIKRDGQLIDAFAVEDERFQGGRFGVYNHSQTGAAYTVSVSDLKATNVYWYDVEAVDPDGDAVTYSLVDAPIGSWINPTTGTIRWETTTDEVGAYPIIIEVRDEHGATARQRYQLVVLDEQPVIVSDPLTTAYVNEEYRYLVTAIDPNPDDVLSYSLVSGPEGTSVVPTSGLLTWTPGTSDLDSHDFTVRVTDSLGLVDEQSFTVQVTEKPPNEPPHFVSEPTRVAYVGQLYRYAPKAVDPDGDPVQYGLVGDLPYHMQIFDGENITWQPGADQVREWTITVDARDGKGGVDEQTFTITVKDITGNNPPSILSTPETIVEAGAIYQYAVSAFDPDGDPLIYSLTRAPDGMSISAAGLIEWQTSADDVAYHDIEVRVEDGRGGYAAQEYRLAVVTSLDNESPSISSIPATSVVAGADYQYDVEASDPDGNPLNYTLAQSPAGMTIGASDGLIEWATSAADLGDHPVVIEVRDGRNGLATQSYTLTVAEETVPNQAPFISSSPITVTRSDEMYSYQIEATDPDGDTLSYSLTEAPPNMSVNSSTGLLEWAPTADDVGDHPVAIEVRDGRSGIATQAYTLTVVDSAENHPPQIQSAPPTNAKVGFEYRYSVIAVDPEGDSINYTLIEAPASMTVSNSGEILWTPGAAGQVPVTVRADDGQAYQQQSWTITVADAGTELAVEVFAQPSVVDAGEPVTITVVPSGMSGQYAVSAKLDGEDLPLDAANQAVVTLSEIGIHEVTAALSDDFGSVTDTTTFTVRDPTANPPPVVTLTQPTYQQEVTVPIDVVGSVEDDNLESWVLAVKPRNNPNAQPRVIAQGNAVFTEQAIDQFDPTQLTNGLYTIILQATDLSGQTAFASQVVRVTGDLKVGNFSITFEDVSIPLAGIPIRVTRTYDSRRRFQSLDFGQGWSVGYQNGRVAESRTIGFGWDLYEYDRGFFSEWCVQPNGAPIVTINLGTGELYSFKAKAIPECQLIVPRIDVNIGFEAIDGTDAKLEQLDFGQVRLVNGNIVDLGAPGEPIDPSGYRLTTTDGMVYRLDQSFGVVKITEPGGQYVTFSDAGILHSSGVGVDFVRDVQGRITAILLPDGESLSYQYDANGDLVDMTDQLGQSASYTYDPNFPHYLRDIVDPRGVRVTRNIYDDSGRLIATIDADGNRIEYSHDIEGRISQVRDRRGNLTTYVYDDQGRVLAETNALGETITHTYNEEGFELTRTNALGQTTTWTYDDHGNRLTATNALGQTKTMTYNGTDRLLSLTAPDGTVVMTNTYDPNSLALTSTSDALGHTTTFVYDAGIGTGGTGQLLSATDALGGVTTYDYDFGGNYLIGETNALGTETHYLRDAMGRILEERTTRTLADGTVQTLVTTYVYDAAGRRIQTTRPDGSVTTMEYNALDKLAEACDALNHCTTYSYDDQGRRVQTTYPDGTTETTSYDAAGNVIARTDRAGHTTRMVYDAANRLIETIYPDGTPADDTDNPRETRDYDAAGRLISVTDERGNTTTYEYDAAGRRTAVIDALGNRTDFILDQRGRKVAVMDADGHVTRFVFDAAGRRTATRFPDATPSDDTDNPRITRQYDALGRKIAQTDAAGQTTRYVYDALGRLTQVIEPDPVTGTTPLPTEPGGTRTTYGYDAQGNKVSQTDALGRTTTWTYDKLGRVTSRTLPLGQTETFAFDANGNRIAHTDFAGQTTMFDYGVMDRRIAVHAPDQEVALSYTPTGRRHQVTVQPGSTGLQVGTTTWTYDARDRLIEITYPDGQGIQYGYDAAGNRTALTTLAGGVVTATTAYTFDALNRLETVTGPVGTTTYTYNADGDLTQVAYPNGTAQVNSFDARHRLISRVNQQADGTLLTEHVYTLSDDNRRLALQEANGRFTAWTYDALDRLIEEQVTDPTRGNRVTTIEYDLVGNRVRRETVCDPSPCQGESLEEGVVTYAYDANDRLISKTGPAGTTTYSFDANGNRTGKAGPQGTSTYTYNNANRLVEATTPMHSLAFTYNLAGIRQTRTQDGNLTDYLTDPNRAYAQVIEARDGSGSLLAHYVHGQGLISQTRFGQTRFYHTDGLGSTRALTDEAGQPTDAYGYAAYGQTAYETGTTDNLYRYTGEQFDAALSQYYLRARYYDPGTGRFTRMDTFGGFSSQPLTLHKYLYAVANPINGTDPSGNLTLPQISIGISVGAILGVSVQTVVGGFYNTYFNPDGRPTHYYETDPIKICTPSPRCTPETVYHAMLLFPAPAHFDAYRSTPVQDGEDAYVGWLAFPGGPVIFDRKDQELTLVNQTKVWHILHNGKVTRTAKYGEGGVTIATVGEGDNHTAFIAWANELVGEAAFEALDKEIRRHFQ